MISNVDYHITSYKDEEPRPADEAITALRSTPSRVIGFCLTKKILTDSEPDNVEMGRLVGKTAVPEL
jgi:hypothetical protein